MTQGIGEVDKRQSTQRSIGGSAQSLSPNFYPLGFYHQSVYDPSILHHKLIERPSTLTIIMAFLRYKLIVGIDFGTTSTGVAISTTSDRNRQPAAIYQITQWPGGMASKTPSRICYPLEGSHSEYEWGFLALPGPLTYAWNKLLLLEASQAEHFRDTELAELAGEPLMMLPPGKSAVGLVADYLRQVRDFLFKQGIFQTLQAREIWFAIPTMSSESMQSHMEEAIEMAGFETYTDGLSKSKFVREQLKLSFHFLKVVAAERPETAASQGAVIKARDGLRIENQRYPRHYGEEPRMEGESTVKHFELLHRPNNGLNYTILLFSSNQQGQPKMIGDPGLSTPTLLACDLSQVRLDRLASVGGPGERFIQFLVSPLPRHSSVAVYRSR
ncbi:hypothetical protein BO71DRAFT_433670 [Aspergillus ellipticus CBS 707.79]|uniref:Actin-like ATPase domain-containing protein n=1 Tax=Aspergillus ellipticus CBS 707.79 TaxID=1448320 RepID=A0A319DRB0_9EURO|nr:hypothetical protein BO71DRAFT_433670 [Aspergillus ellipticus CBS 707.79]